MKSIKTGLALALFTTLCSGSVAEAAIISATYTGTVTGVYYNPSWSTRPVEFNVAVNDSVTGTFRYDTNQVLGSVSYGDSSPYGTLYEVPSTDLLTAQIGTWSWISGEELPDFIHVRNDQPKSGGLLEDELIIDVRRGLSFPFQDSKAYHNLSIIDDVGPLDLLSNELLPAFFDISQITSMTGRIETGDYTSGPNYSYWIEYSVDLQSLQVTVTDVPEPATLTLLGISLAGMGALRKNIASKTLRIRS